MKITDISLFRLSGRWTGPTFPPGNRQAQQLDIYPEFNALDKSASLQPGQQIQAIYVEINTDEGISGIFGPIDPTQAFIIRTSLSPFFDRAGSAGDRDSI